jgi:NAD(P)-dependent dehydrogenase (short-subunit alcohol dehydrogenase family)
LFAYLKEGQDAQETRRLVEEAGRKAVLVAGDISSAEHCRAIIDRCVKELGGIDILVNNAAHQATFKSMEPTMNGSIPSRSISMRCST